MRTKVHAEAVAVLATLLRAKDEQPPVVLLGAGASFRSGVPTAGEAVKQIARRFYSERILAGSRPPERVKPSEWESWLRQFSWFLHGEDRLGENFPLVVEHLLTPAEFRKIVLLDLMQPRHGISAGYRSLSDFVMRGLIRTILTTNFDTCVVDALRERQPHIRHIAEVNRGPGDYAEFNLFSKCQVVWLHGRAEQYSDRNSAGETNALDSDFVSLLRPLLENAPIVVVGYRGAEPSVMEGVFGKSREGRQDFPHGVFWCVRGDETAHPHVEALGRRLKSNFRLLRIDGFDELFGDLAGELAGEDRYAAGPSQYGAGRTHETFDETVLDGISVDDLDLDMALPVLRTYCEKLGRAPVTSETLLTLMREQALLVPKNGFDGVTAAALLLFGRHPQDRFPHAVITITQDGKGREIYSGNLISQHRKLLEKLDSPDVNPSLKVKKRRQHDQRPAYPPRVLVELLVNMLVHRDYEVPEIATIDVRAGSLLAFANPGGLTVKIEDRVEVGADGQFTPAEGLTDQRNPSLCDIFFGISAMERAGTGLMDVRQLMVESGGDATFYHRAKERSFEAHVAQPQASAGSRSIARLDVPTGIYILNSLPFRVVPDAVSIVQLKMPLRQRPATVDLSQCGVFVDRGTALWSFVPLQILTSLLDEIVDHAASAAIPRTQIEASADDRRVLSWLLRKHWERYLLGFQDDGLVLEGARHYRAYFEGKNRGNRTVTWQNAQERKFRRDVVKKRSDRARPWFENEGFSYDVVPIGDLWTVRVKPFYMFTGPDGRTPLPSFVRTGKATSRMKFDRNKSVESDLTFWSSFLGRHSETINIGGLHVDDLLLEASFLSEEVPEIGLDNDDVANQDRVPA